MLKIGGRQMTVPIIQGGMGIGVSLGGLAGAVAACGGMGVISSANTGYAEPDFWQNHAEANRRTFQTEILRAKRIAAGKGLVGVNIMVATRAYPESVKIAVEAGADAIICGAGLPSDLPGLVSAVNKEAEILLAPIVSGGKAARTICRLWDRRYNVTPDFVVIEGAEAGGHLGFKKDELLNGTALPLMEILAEVKAELAEYEQKYGREIPVFVAGGVYSGQDVAKYMQAGAAGAQIATRFIATEECDAADGYKQAMLAAKAEDVRIVQSPVGMPGRALNSPLFKRLDAEGRIKPESCVNCIVPCKPAETPYCISRALIAAVQGDWENGLFFCGSNVGRLNKIVPVAELMAEIMDELTAGNEI